MSRFFVGQILEPGMFPIIDDIYRIDTTVERRWFVATVDSRVQNAMLTADETKRAAFADIKRLAFDVYTPRRTYWGPKDRKTNKQPRCTGPAMPGYVFAHLPFEGAFERFIACDGIRRILTNAGSPQSIQDVWIDRIKDREVKGGFDETSGRRGVKHGPFPDWVFPTAVVRVVKGPFASFNAQILDAIAYGRVRAEVGIFGRQTPIELELDQVAQIC